MFRFLPVALTLLLFLFAPPARADGPATVATVKPVHSLAAGVMVGVGVPHLLIDGAGSPHGFALKPSDARRLQGAGAVVWVGEALETFLARPLRSLAQGAKVVTLMEAPGVKHLEIRQAGVLAEDAHGHGHDHGHDAARTDGHIWLDPANAIAMTRAIADALAAADPANGAAYRANASAQIERIGALDRELARRLAPAGDRPYVVFHDAYQYFEKRYGLAPAAAITVSPDRPPGARRLREIRAAIRKTSAACVFVEPQFTPRIAQTVVEGTGARIAVLDPLGADISPGADAYGKLMTRLADDLLACLTR